jgi:hypothetical protein
MLRTIGAIFAGLAAFAAFEFSAGCVARTIWPAYALAFPMRAYTLDMLLARHAVGMLCALAAGATAARIDPGAKRTVLITGILMLLIAVVWHIRIWDQYPVWYHLLLFAYLVPLAALGGKLVSVRKKADA